MINSCMINRKTNQNDPVCLSHTEQVAGNILSKNLDRAKLSKPQERRQFASKQLLNNPASRCKPADESPV